jgi:hypothetical protein
MNKYTEDQVATAGKNPESGIAERPLMSTAEFGV